MNLSKRQQEVVDHVLNKKNVFFTGSAGCGKSFVLQHIVELLPRTTTFITALTGAAAIRIRGTTLHSWAGIRLGNGTREELLARLTRQAYHNIASAVTLIIDEVSMLTAELFDKIEWIAQQVRANETPFGGIQLIMSGDFYQLPPVNKKLHQDDPDVQMLFESDRFDVCVPHVIELDEIFRQRDQRFINMLNEVRHNRCSQETLATLTWLARPLKFDDGITPTKLFCRNVNVDIQNARELARLKTEEYKFTAKDDGKDPWLSQMDTHCSAPSVLRLRVGAQVILLFNDPGNRLLVNGSRGVVTRFDNELPVVKFACGVEQCVEWHTWTLEDRRGNILASRYQIPLMLGFCASIHRAQGLTIDRLEVKIDDAFEYGMAYVALSRATDLDGLRVVAYDARKFRINPKVRKWYKKIRERQDVADLAKTLADVTLDEQKEGSKEADTDQPGLEKAE